MQINGFSTGLGIQGNSTFGDLNIEKGMQNLSDSAGDQVYISDQAKELHASMQSSNTDISNMSPGELETFLANNPEAAARLEASNGEGAQVQAAADGADKAGARDDSGNGTKGGGGQGGGGGSTSTDSTTSQTSLESQIQDLEMQIAQAEEEAEISGNNAQVEALEAELQNLEDELDELTEA